MSSSGTGDIRAWGSLNQTTRGALLILIDPSVIIGGFFFFLFIFHCQFLPHLLCCVGESVFDALEGLCATRVIVFTAGVFCLFF